MPILKRKIALAVQAKTERDNTLSQPQEVKKAPNKRSSISSKESKMVKCEAVTVKEEYTGKAANNKKTKQYIRATKTVVKNYGKAIASFAASYMATPYLTPLVEKYAVDLKEFTDYMVTVKETIEGIDTFRALLLINDDGQFKDGCL